jgi:3-oxoacyl-[acyl-carrier protein] reductase
MLLNKRVAIVTGASRGIGRAIALAMAEQGAAVAVNANRSAEAAESVAAEIRQGGGEAIVGIADVSDRDAVDRMVADTRSRLGPIDILVNNAAIDHVVSFEEITSEEWDRILAVNLKGVFHCCQAVIGEMKERRSGKIICISSVAGLRGSLFGNVHYAASKAGMHGFVMTLARQVAPHGINVNAIAPGPIETEMFRQNVSGERRQQVLAGVPLGVMGQPEDIAHATVYLASEWARFITGVVLRVNGGSLMG